MRQVNLLLDRVWTEPLPILAWAIETDEGVVVVDTGETRGRARPVISRVGIRTFGWLYE